MMLSRGMALVTALHKHVAVTSFVAHHVVTPLFVCFSDILLALPASARQLESAAVVLAFEGAPRGTPDLFGRQFEGPQRPCDVPPFGDSRQWKSVQKSRSCRTLNCGREKGDVAAQTS